jgi:hypothetical protein
VLAGSSGEGGRGIAWVVKGKVQILTVLMQAVVGGGEGERLKTKEGKKNTAKVKKRGSGGG